MHPISNINSHASPGRTQPGHRTTQSSYYTNVSRCSTTHVRPHKFRLDASDELHRSLEEASINSDVGGWHAIRATKTTCCWMAGWLAKSWNSHLDTLEAPVDSQYVVNNHPADWRQHGWSLAIVRFGSCAFPRRTLFQNDSLSYWVYEPNSLDSNIISSSAVSLCGSSKERPLRARWGWSEKQMDKNVYCTLKPECR